GGSGGAGVGGAIFNLNGTVNLTNDTIAANTGGALYNLAFGNALHTGAAVSAVATINNTILANSTRRSALIPHLHPLPHTHHLARTPATRRHPHPPHRPPARRTPGHGENPPKRRDDPGPPGVTPRPDAGKTPYQRRPDADAAAVAHQPSHRQGQQRRRHSRR